MIIPLQLVDFSTEMRARFVKRRNDYLRSVLFYYRRRCIWKLGMDQEDDPVTRLDTLSGYFHLAVFT